MALKVLSKKAAKMKAPNAYQIHPYIGFVRDAELERPTDKELAKRFRDAMVMFRVRIEQLSSLEHVTTTEESDSLTVMLEALLKAKGRLQKKLDSPK
jgi:hypothetical protein